MFLEKHLWSKVILEKFQQKDGDKFSKMSDKMKYKKDLFMGGNAKHGTERNKLKCLVL